MNVNLLEKLLREVKEGSLDVPSALQSLRSLPFEQLEFATLDTHRALRQGYPEVVFGQGKSIAQMKAIIKNMLGGGENVLATRVDAAKGKALLKAFPKGEYREVPSTFFVKSHPVKKTGKGTILVISAGTSDVPVAEEAATTAEYMGNSVKRLFDVGVSGIHRLLHRKEELWDARVLIVVAGMEGALPSVVAGLVARPVIAVPTSVGYGANLGGLTTLMAMLNSCASGVTVVNIDNGFGAAYAASLMNKE